MVSSGLRIGTPALATRGFGETEFREVADIIAEALKGEQSATSARTLRDRVEKLAATFPLYPHLTPPPERRRGMTAQPLPEHPDFLWRNPEPRSSYDVVIVGAGGHGLATAYYLAKNHGITNVAVLEKGWLAGGNMARNTTIIRSNYLWDESAAIYEHALKLWERLPEELDYDFLFSQRGVLNLAHTLQDVREGVRRVNANRLNGVDAEWLEPDEVAKVCPILNVSSRTRYPVLGATFQPRAGIAKHDHVAWALARRGRRAGRGPDPGLRGHRLPQGRRPGRGRRDQPRPHPRRPGRSRGRRAQQRAGRAGRAYGCRCSPIRCRRWSPSCTSRCTRPSSCRTTCTSTSPRRTRASW